jgi:predicted MFS family arabinose efflux permease
MVGGVSSLLIMPVVGKLSDKADKFTIFAFASVWMMLVVYFYTNLTPVPLWVIMLFNVAMMIGIFSRMVPSMALATALPQLTDRGAFMSINSSLQQISGGIAAIVGGLVVVQKDKHSPLEHYDTLGYLIIAISILGIGMVYRMSNVIKAQLHLRKI